MKERNIKKPYGNSTFALAKSTIKSLHQTHKKIFYGWFVGTILLGICLNGLIQCGILKSENMLYDASIFNVVILGLTKDYLLTLIIVLILNWVGFRFIMPLYRPQERDEERNITYSEDGVAGTAHKATSEEIAESYQSGYYNVLKGTIIGSSLTDNMDLKSIKPGYGINGNILITGAPGSGKTRCFVIPIAFQAIRRRDSMIITDPKGELYKVLSETAKANHYEVKILNINPRQMYHSDAIDIMSVVNEDQSIAESIAHTIVQNTSDGKSDVGFWTDSEYNELVFAILYNSGLTDGTPKTLGSIYQFLNTNNIAEIEIIGNSLPDSNPAKGYFNTWNQGSKVVKMSTHGGLQIRLGKFNNPLLRKITGTKDMTFTGPGERPCMYFISSSDQDDSMQFIVALTFTLFYQELVNLADSLPSQQLKTKVIMLMDEFANSGSIPYFPNKLSTVRSRGIDTIMIIQGLEQLQKKYPENEWETIINDCSMNILLRTNSLLTAKYYSERSGDASVVSKGKSYDEYVGDILQIHPNYSSRESITNRPVFTPHELLTLPKERIVAILTTCNIAEFKKIDYSYHPMSQEIREITPTQHTPDWVFDLDENDKIDLNIKEDTYEPQQHFEIALTQESDYLPENTRVFTYQNPQKEEEEEEEKGEERDTKSKSKNPPASESKEKSSCNYHSEYKKINLSEIKAKEPTNQKPFTGK